MTWFVINTLAFIGAPIGLIWGWIAYSTERRVRPGVRTHISFLAISGTSLSVIGLGFCLVWARLKGLGTSDPTIHALVTLGVWMGVLGAAISFAGRVRTLLPILFASLGAVLLWYGLSLY